MKDTIFDLVEEEIPSGKKGYFEIAKRAPEPKDDSFLNSVADYSKTIAKGATEGVLRLGRMMGPLQENKPSSQIQEEQTEVLDKLLPTDEGFTQKAIRRGLQQAPTAVSFPGAPALNTLTRAAGAGFLGEGAKELGAPEWVQTAAELTSYIGPDITKKLLEKGKNSDIIAFGKKMGLTDQEITPLLQSDFKQKWLSKISPKRGSTQSALKKTKSALDESYGTLKNSESALGEISEVENGKLINGVLEKINEMPREVRGKIEADLMDLLNNKITGKSLINFYADLSSHYGENTKQLSLLKDPVKKALHSISPNLGEDFEMINKLYTKYYPIASKLKPTIASDIIGAAETIGILGSVSMGYYPPLVSLLGEKAAKKLAQQLLINPRFQHLSKKMIVAMNQNKYQVVKKLTDAFRNQIKEYSPKVAEELDKISEEDIRKLLMTHQEKEEQQASKI